VERRRIHKGVKGTATVQPEQCNDIGIVITTEQNWLARIVWDRENGWSSLPVEQFRYRFDFGRGNIGTRFKAFRALTTRQSALSS
jgi:hypothetical protein